MKLCTCVLPHSAKETVAVLREDLVYPASAFNVYYETMNDLIIGHTKGELERLENGTPYSDGYPVSEVKFLAPIPRPLQDVLCLGLNYTDHAKEAAGYSKNDFTAEKAWPVYFSKRVSYAPGTGETVPAYENLTQTLDYEVELAVILGKDALNVKYEDAEDYIFGYTIVNDMTAREVQTRHKQWYFGKSFDKFCPMGPVIVTKNEVSFPPALPISSYVNGTLRQNANTDMMIHSISRVISELSEGMTLKAGTIIATGTPKGVAMGLEHPAFLKSGDKVTCVIEGIGTLENTIE